MFKKFFVKCLYLFFILVFLCSNIIYATVVTVTDENLKTAIENVVSSEDDNEEIQSISVSDNTIQITANDGSYNLTYDLTDKPTFSFEIPIEKGMSYDEFKKQESKMLGLPMIGYCAVANIEGVAVEDSSAYFAFSYLGSAFNGSFDSSNSYIIIDDTVEGYVKVETTDSNVIYVSEFGERVVEYVNNMYKENQAISDSEGINSYTYSLERKDVTETSCKLVSTVRVNLDADFSKIIGFTEKMTESSMYKDITKENADLVLTLKVGQKCKLEATEDITGYELAGYDCVEINDEKTEIAGKMAGLKNGYIYVGNEKKSIYITVEENTQDISLETIKLKIASELKFEEKEGRKYISITNTMNAQKLLNKIVSYEDLEVVDKNGNVLGTSVNIGTGTKVIQKETKEEAYTLIVYGDVTGDGKISIAELAVASKMAANLPIGISAIQFKALDVSKDEKITVSDLAVLSRLMTKQV